ncbi:MAG: BlaI/MecI/CopY family transcriptional regulator [Fimbriimonas sp.]|nr:BlaI/MecI/CopY family transcriptional regulator [Fimbriimonas sp.]
MNEDIRANEHAPLGEQQLDLLRFVSEHGPITVGDVAREYGAPRGLARTTILTVMERLRTKGYLVRRPLRGVFCYSAKNDHNDVLKNLVADFVQRSLSGSLAPFVTYMADSGRLSKDEIDELRRIVDSLETEEEPVK